MRELAKSAKALTHEMASATTEQKNGALRALIENLWENRSLILEANQQDLAAAKELSAPMLERMALHLEGIIHDIGEVIALPDPIGEWFEERTLPNSLHIAKCRTPLGVLGAIYESRPNVTLDIASLAIKSGNCALLRGGSETLCTNQVLVQMIQRALHRAGLPSKAIQLIANTDRSAVKEMLQCHESIDLIIPRGSTALQQFCREHSTIPVVTGGIGICHLFVDASADLERSLEVILNAKTQRPTVCNALDTLLVHEQVAHFIPRVVQTLSEKGVSFRLDEKAMQLVSNGHCQLAGPNDWDTEWLSLVLGIKVVAHLPAAILHIQQHGTGHSDGILTESIENGKIFIQQIDSAAVYINASTRFTDGGQFGLGAEVAISTQKLHARGPMGLKELTTYKWVVRGDYQVRK
ncbi:MAG TPA: glutamate-5-semialdehyde dehydrogenase [Chlamydiales bacterium]|nr:glutamate-5-semialdehyde dehydrogenase [Chlamydiales bacterium]